PRSHPFPTRRSSDLKPRSTKQQDRQARRDEAAPDTDSALTDSEVLAAIAKDSPRKPTIAAQALGILLVLVALAGTAVITGLTLGDRKSTRLNSSHEW